LTLLADRGQHRAPSIPDLTIAAAAELAGLTVLHLDKDFDLIAEVTGQPMQRLTIDSAADMGDDTEQTEALSFPDSGRCGRSAGPFRPRPWHAKSRPEVACVGAITRAAKRPAKRTCR
jgi:hypothetical protein